METGSFSGMLMDIVCVVMRDQKKIRVLTGREMMLRVVFYSLIISAGVHYFHGPIWLTYVLGIGFILFKMIRIKIRVIDKN